MNRISVGLVGPLMALTLALPASADENTGFFAGASLGYSMLEAAEDIEIGDVESEFELDDEDFAWKAFIGYQLLPWLALDGGYVDLGTASESGNALSLDTDIDGWEAFLVGNLPLGFVDDFRRGVAAVLTATSSPLPHASSSQPRYSREPMVSNQTTSSTERSPFLPKSNSSSA